MAWLSGWSKRIKITIDKDQVDGDLVNFPVPIYLSASSGQNTDDVSAIFDELSTVSGTKKIAITTSDEETQCYIEIERWDWSNEKAWLHTKVPTIVSGTDTDLYLYYDSTQVDNTTYVGDVGDVVAQSVWNSDFVRVWHMSQDPTGGAGCILDSTGNYNATPVNMEAGDLVDGLFGKGLNFDGSGERIDIDNCGLDGVSAYTVTLALKPDVINFTAHRGAFARGSAGLRTPWIFGNLVGATITHQLQTTGAGTGDRVEVKTGALTTGFCVIDSTFGSSNINIYTNGVLANGPVATYSSTAANSSGNNYIAEIVDYDTWDGIISEVRVATAELPPAWLKATYEGLWDNLLVFGVEEEEASLFYFSGYTFEEGNPISRILYLHDRTSGNLVDTTTSSGNGYYYLETTSSGAHYIVCLDNESGEDYNDMILGNMIPIEVT